jgi:hypothetical protein
MTFHLYRPRAQLVMLQHPVYAPPKPSLNISVSLPIDSWHAPSCSYSDPISIPQRPQSRRGACSGILPRSYSLRFLIPFFARQIR